MLKKYYLCEFPWDYVTGHVTNIGQSSHVLMHNLIFFNTCKSKQDIKNRNGDTV